MLTAFVLSISKADSTTEKWSYKWGMIYSGGAWSFKMVFILLTKVIAIYVKFSWIGLQGSNFKWLFLGSACSRSWAWIDSTNAFMNFVKKSLVGGIRSRVGASRGVEALLQPASDLSSWPWGPASSSCSLVRLVRGLLQELHQARDPRTITMELWPWFFQMNWLTYLVWSF